MLLISLMLLASPILTFTIPANQPNGVYSVSYNADGEEVHSLIQAIEKEDFAHVPRTVRDFQPLVKKGGDTQGCIYDQGGPLNHADTDAANNALDAQCGTGTAVQAHMNFYSIVGGTVAYFCNYSGYARICDKNMRRWTSGSITADCGPYMPGWYWAIEANWAYGYENHDSDRGKKFCNAS